MLSLIVKENRIFNLALRDAVGGATVNGQALNAFTLTGAGTYFTETFDVGTFTEGILFLLTQAHGGTNPTLDVKLQLSPDGINWIDAGDAFTQVTTTDSLTLKKLTANFGKYARCLIVVGGTVSPNYKLSLWAAMKV